MATFLVTAKSRTDENRRLYTLSSVPCDVCGGGPARVFCNACEGSGQQPATRDTARQHVERIEQANVDFRLDSPGTFYEYPNFHGQYATPQDLTDHVLACTWHVRKDTDEDGRFVRAGKVLLRQEDGAHNLMRAWRSYHEQAEPFEVVEVGDVTIQNVVTAGQYGVPAKNRSDGTANGAINWATDTIKIMLTSVTYVPDIDVHDFQNDVTNEVTGTNWSAGGVTLASPTSVYDSPSDQAQFKSSAVSVANTTLTGARIAVGYKSTGTAATSPLIFFVNFGADVSTTAGTFQITPDVTGWWITDVT